MNVVAVEIPKSIVETLVPGLAVQFDQQAELLVEDIGPGAAAYRPLPSSLGQAVRSLDITAVYVFKGALDAVEIIEERDEQFSMADTCARTDRRP